MTITSTHLRQQTIAGCGALLAAAALLTACSSSGSKPSGGSNSTAGTSSVATSTTAPSSGLSSSSSSSGGGGGGSLSLGGGSFCSEAKTEQAQEDKTINAFTDTPASLKTIEQDAAKELPEFEALAPSAIKPDVKVVVTVDEQLIASLAKVNYDMTKLSPATLNGFNSPAVMTANKNIINYLSSVCGIKPSAGASVTG